jgi:hypothetical protein
VLSGAVTGQRMCDYPKKREGPDPEGTFRGRDQHEAGYLAPSGELNTDPARSA